MRRIFFGDFANESNVLDTWTGSNLDGAEVLLAWYGSEGYDGSAFIVYRKDGKLYEANDGHCSCYGLESWEPEETTAEALAMRDFSYSEDGVEANAALKELLRDLGASRS